MFNCRINILVTGVLKEEADVDLIKEFILRGASDYLFKGHLDRLASAVKQALEKGCVS
jgi:hypothetical protein